MNDKKGNSGLGYNTAWEGHGECISTAFTRFIDRCRL